MDPVIMTGRRLNPLRDSRPESLPELGGVDYSASHGVPRRKRIVAMLSLRAALKPRVGMCSPTASGRTRSKPPKPTRLLEPLEPRDGCSSSLWSVEMAAPRASGASR